MTHLPAPTGAHVLIVPSWYPSTRRPSDGLFFRDQALALRKRGFRVGVIAPEVVGLRAFLRRPESGLGIHRDDDAGVPTHRKAAVPILPRFSRRNAWFWMAAGRRLFDDYVEQAGMPDLIHAHCALYGGLLAHRLHQRHGLPFVVTEHSSAFARGRPRRWMSKAAGEAFAAASARLVVSPALGILLTTQFTDRFCPWQCVPNILDADFQRPIDDKPDRTAAQVTFLCVGTLRAIKAQDVLIAAFARRFAGDGSAQLRLAGTGAKEAEFRHLAASLGIADQVDFLGHLDRQSVRREMLAADALVLPSYYDTFGVVTIEALACGTPVIATTGSGPESVINRSNGFLVPPGDVDALAHALGQMREARETFQAETLHNDCLERFGSDAVVDQLAAIYAGVLQPGTAAPADRAAA